MKDIKFIVGQRIRSYRVQKHLSQEQLSELADCHPTYIGQLERGEKNATLESIQKIANALNITLSQLFEKIEETQNDESIPLKSYEFFSSKTIKEQKYLYQLLQEIDEYKNTNLYFLVQNEVVLFNYKKICYNTFKKSIRRNDRVCVEL